MKLKIVAFLIIICFCNVLGSDIVNILNDPAKLRQVTQAAFIAVDADGSGFLEVSELSEVMNQVASDIFLPPPTQEELEEVLKELDTNNDGKLPVEEFEVLIRLVLEMSKSRLRNLSEDNIVPTVLNSIFTYVKNHQK